MAGPSVPTFQRKINFEMVPAVGIKPTTSSMSTKRSITELCRQITHILIISLIASAMLPTISSSCVLEGFPNC